jgi:hypothetical protein
MTTAALDAPNAILADRNDALRAMKRILLRARLDGRQALVLSAAVAALEADPAR